MLIIFASRFDRNAQVLSDRWSAHDANLLTAQDLSVAGWRYYDDPNTPSIAIVGGRTVNENDITGVLVRWPAVYEAELGNVVDEDRGYVANEMTAFLCAWLTHLKCPVLNHPTASALWGPAWRPEKWVHVAAQLGIPVTRICRRAGKSLNSVEAPAQVSSTVVTVVGDRYFGTDDQVLGQHSLRLAKAANTHLLAVHFDGPERGAAMLTANLLPDLTNSEISDAVLAYLLGGSVETSSSKDLL